MKEQPIVFERVYEATVAKVWKALTDKNDMKQWYFDISDFKPEVGFEFSFVGGDGKKSFLHLCKIVEVVPYKKLKHSWRYDGYEGNSFVTWELSEEGKNKTRVKLTHDGLETFPHQTADFAKGNFIQGWTQITGVSLLEFVETADITKILEASSSPDILWNISPARNILYNGHPDLERIQPSTLTFRRVQKCLGKMEKEMSAQKEL